MGCGKSLKMKPPNNCCRNAHTWVVILIVLLAGLLFYVLQDRQLTVLSNTGLFRDEETTGQQCRPSPHIQGTTGRVYQLSKARTYEGRRELAPATSTSCKPYSARAGRRCDRWIVVTTIHPSTPILRKISSLSGWCMVVVADKKGPVTMDIPNVDYLDVVQQESCGYQICRLLPWNHFGRKNIGYLYAIEHGAEMIYDTDDDNQPLFDELPAFDNVGYSKQLHVAGHLWNPYPQFGANTKMWPRGFPLSRITDPATKRVDVINGTVAARRAGVVQFLAQHDPDIDAIYRLTNELPYEFDPAPRRLFVPERVMSPYNAQATLHAHQAFWGLLLPVSVHGRVSDIWRSYFTQRLLWDIGMQVAFHSPFVVQYRNPHNYMADFDSEMDLYYKAETLVKFLQEWTPEKSSTSLQQILLDLAIRLYEFDFFGVQDVTLTEAWIQDLQCLGYKFPLHPSLITQKSLVDEALSATYLPF
ncbi:probable glycosyltransferase STELLO1 [Patiria miniata]|uniref:Uncharacterized protein n=1 Tax=Patiria miniata TaxID=46514 RepID=A0A914BHD3_PATMI|nr:probable glycosyltransferase STELLO1 [Patiria miniata]